MSRLTVLSLVLLAAPAYGQAPEPRTTSYFLRILPVMGTESLQKEIGLSPDQAARLRQFREKLQEEDYKLTRKELAAKAEQRIKDADKLFADTLKPEQLARLKEIARQQFDFTVTSPLPPRLGVLPAELLTELKVTEQQKARHDERTQSLWSILTPQQKTEWNRLLGKPFEARLSAEAWAPRDRRLTSADLIPSSELMLLRYTSVREDLKITEEQMPRVRPLLGREPTRPFRFLTDPELSAEQAGQKSAAAAQKLRAELAAALRPEQLKRLRQIAVQTERGGRHGRAVLLASEPTAEGLGLTDGQRKQIDEICKARAEALVQLGALDEEIGKLREKLSSTGKAGDDRAVAVLTPQQFEKFKDMVGEPFTRTLDSRDLTILSNAFTATTFDLYSTELGFLSDKALQDELKLSAEQIKMADAAWAKVQGLTRATGADPAAFYKERSDLIEKSLGDILNVEQAKRFREVMIQQRLNRPLGTGGLPGVLAYPGVTKELKVTDDQLDQLRGGAEVEKALTAEQREQAKKLGGEAFAGRLRPARLPLPAFAREPRPAAPPPELRLLQERSVQVELQLTADQLGKLDALEQTRQKKAGVRMAPDPARPFERPGADREVDATVAKEIASILDAKQAERLFQIELQQTAASGLNRAVRLPRVQERLRLSADQINRIESANKRFQEVTRLLQTEYIGFDPDTTAALQDLREKRVLEALSDEQRKEWKALLGEPFKGRLRASAFARFGD